MSSNIFTSQYKLSMKQMSHYNHRPTNNYVLKQWFLLLLLINRLSATQSMTLTFVIEPIRQTLVDFTTDNDRERKDKLGKVRIHDCCDVAYVETEDYRGHSSRARLKLQVDPSHEEDNAK